MRYVRVAFAIAGSIALISTSSLFSQASASTFNVLYSFCHVGGKFVCSDGKNPSAALISDPRGNLYGTTSAGGTTQSGVIFELHRGLNKYSYRVLHSFNCAETCSEGGVPVTPLIIDTKGNLYGTAVSGGSDFGGTVFELSPDRQNKTWTYKVLINFCSQAGTGCLDGMVPQSGLTYAGASTGALYDGTSPLFGTTIEGGSSPGIVYEMTQSGGNWTGTTLYGFCHQANCTDGTTPIGQIAVDTSGTTLYGTTNGGGDANGDGVAYKVDIATGAQTVLHTYCSSAGCADGSGANGGVTLGDGNTVFGTTPLGGANNGGTAFQINAKTGKEKVIYSFCKEADCSDGQGPDAALVRNGANLIGTTSSASTLGGVIFQVNPDKSETVLHTFCQLADCTDGSLPVGVLVDPAGTIFGVTEHGGKRNDGVLYQLTQQ